MVQEGMRAGDADRQRAADQLKVALDEGRLDLGEYDERLQRAYAARTFDDLDGLLADLPGTVPARKARVQPHSPASAPAVKAAEGQHQGSRVTGMFGIFIVCTLVWAMTSLSSGHLQYFWPGWVLIPVVFALLAHFGDRNRRHR